MFFQGFFDQFEFFHDATSLLEGSMFASLLCTYSGKNPVLFTSFFYELSIVAFFCPVHRILSENSINSECVEDEVETAYEQERSKGQTVLFPIKIDNKGC
jgi:hypothetical protein